MGIIAGLFLLALYVLAEIITYLKLPAFTSKAINPLSKTELIRLLIIAAVSVLLMLANPNGFATYLYAYDHTKMEMLKTVNEWMSPFGDKYSDSFVTFLYKVFLFTGLLTLYYSYKKKDILPAIVYVGFAIYSVRAMRFTVDYVIITLIFVVISFNEIILSLKNIKIKDFIAKSPIPKVVLGLFLLIVSILIIGVGSGYDKYDLYLRVLKYYRVTGFGINSDFIPVQMFSFMKENGIPDKGDKIFNHFGTGGFFVWNFPDKKNFIDSRNLNDDIFNKYSDILAKRQGFEKKLDEYGIDYAIYLAPDLVRQPQEMEQTVISYFCKSPDWKLLFWDDKSFLWVRNLPKFKELIEKFEFKILNPYSFYYQKNFINKAVNDNIETLKKEINRKLSEDPQGIVISSFLQNYGNKIGKLN